MKSIRLLVVGLFAVVLTSISVFGYSGGTGKWSSPYLISNKADLLELGVDVANYDKYFTMTTDIDLSGETFTKAVIASFIDMYGTPFSGTFDGNGYEVRNLNIISTTGNIGLFGYVQEGVICNLGVSGSILGAGAVGALCGGNAWGTISSCYSTARVMGTSKVGGICGNGYSVDIISCYSMGGTEGSVDYTGGLCGSARFSTITDCYSMAHVTGVSCVGGLVGENYMSNIASCYSTGRTIGNDNVGGLIGSNIIEGSNHVFCTSSFWDTQTSGVTNSAGGIGKTTADMQTESTFTDVGWNFTDTWQMFGYPILKCQNTYGRGSGTEEDPYIVADLTDFLLFSLYMNNYDKCFKQEADIDLVGLDFTQAIIAPDWVSQNSSFDGIKFTGSYDGGGYAVSNYTINGIEGSVTNDYIGLFGYVDSGVVSNLTVFGSVIGGNCVGGLCGANSGEIHGCYVACSVSGNTSVGGLLGYNYSGGIYDSYASGIVSGGSEVGGLLGSNMGAVYDCYAIGSANGDQYVGGLLGYHHSGAIHDCYANGIVAGCNDVGGLVGMNDSGSVSNCFWDINTSGKSTSAGGTGKTTLEMQTLATFSDAGWNLKDTWRMYAYPVLQWQKPYSGGSGTESEPYIIANKYDIRDLKINTNHYAQCFKVVADIDLSGESFTNAVIAYGHNIKFTGEFDGNGHEISNLSISGNCNYAGLFGYIGTNGVVCDLGVSGCVEGRYYIGGLCGVNEFGTITCCYSKGSVSGKYYVGGLCGYNKGEIVSCYSTESVVDSGDCTGGLCGYNYRGIISSCYSTGNVEGSGNNVGGSCGKNNFGTITDCYSTGSVVGSYDNVGGFCGYNTGTITSCYSRGGVLGGNYVGGLCGYNTEIITACYSTGDIVGDDSVGGLCGKNYGGIIGACFWNTQTSGVTNSAGGIGKTTAEMQTEATFTSAGWNFIDNWRMNGYPILRCQLYDGGSGTEADPYLVSSKLNLLQLNENTNNCDKCFKMTADIDLSGESFTAAVISTQFTGCFDGNGYVISNLRITGSSDLVGLFVLIGGRGVVRDLGVYVNIHGESDVGGLCGCNYGKVISCFAIGNVSGRAEVGGLCGRNIGEVISCYSTASIEGDHADVGGLCGLNCGEVISCYSTGNVVGMYNVGGLCGFNSLGNIHSCYSTGSVTGIYGTSDGISTGLGGLCGSNNGNISFCYSVGSVVGFRDVGGLCGRYEFGGTVSSCFWDTQISGKLTSDGGIGKTTVEMQTEAIFTDAGWNFVDTWSNTGGFPTLKWQNSLAVFDCRVFGGNGGATYSPGESIDISLYTESSPYFKTWVVEPAEYSNNFSDIIAENTTFTMPATNVQIRAFISNYSGGSGTGDDPYLICNKDDFLCFGVDCKNYGKCFKLTSDIDLSGETFTNAVIAPNRGFTGCFDGGGSTVSNLVINGSASYIGLFGRIGNGGSVYDIGLSGSISGNNNYVGGIAGYNEGGVVSKCYSLGSVSGNDYVGGLIGRETYGTILNSYSLSSVSGNNYVGGLVGCMMFDKINKCYSTGSVSGGGGYVGGLVGDVFGVFITNCVWDINTSGKLTSAGGEIGKTTVEMQTETTFTDVGWDFDNIWVMDGYPILQWQLLAPPSYITATDGTRTDGVELNWATVNEATHYKVYRSTSKDGTKVFSAWFAGTSLLDTTATPGVTYYYWVTAACSSTGERESGFSPYNKGYRTSTGQLPAPLTIYASNGTYADGVNLCWTPIAEAISYKIYRSTSETGSKVSSGWISATNLLDTTVTSGVTYYYWVTAARSSTGNDQSDFSPFTTGYKFSAAYLTWLSDFGVPFDEQGYDDTPADDSIQNLLKYAIGLNPMEACSTADLLEVGDGGINGVSVIYNKAKGTVGVELFPAWTDCLLPADWNTDGFELSLRAETSSNETWKATHSVTGECGYIRLRAQMDN
jgi:hypothetical protein